MHNRMCRLEHRGLDDMCFGSTLPRQRGGRTPPRTHVSKDVKCVTEGVALSAALSLREASRPRPKEGKVRRFVAPATRPRGGKAICVLTRDHKGRDLGGAGAVLNQVRCTPWSPVTSGRSTARWSPRRRAALRVLVRAISRLMPWFATSKALALVLRNLRVWAITRAVIAPAVRTA